MLSLVQIQNLLRASGEDIRQRFGIVNLAVFGSAARGEARLESDIDLFADVPKSLSLLGLVSAENHLTDILGSKVDLIPRDSIRPELRDRILREAVPV